MTPGSSWSELAVGPARKAVGEVDRPAGLDWSGGGEKKRQRLAGSVGLFVRTLAGQARVLRQQRLGLANCVGRRALLFFWFSKWLFYLILYQFQLYQWLLYVHACVPSKHAPLVVVH
jgi:hypothetical protein